MTRRLKVRREIIRARTRGDSSARYKRSRGNMQHVNAHVNAQCSDVLYIYICASLRCPTAITIKTNPSRVYLSLVGNALIIIRSTSTDEKERKVGERAGRYHRECVHQSHVEFAFLILLRSFINLICVTLPTCVKLPGPRRPVHGDRTDQSLSMIRLIV